ncbi:ATP-dependent RNA helicase RhlE [Candidatus Rhodobacter oscarellae]|uniref:ATP-dependent RNA helicase RhlE n=1 Tax=Candidatus Rhodobacter oscarellae TaxID=1675527 RepID=A0A0J9E9I6_9RHOB|nr:DEAD/DEAH box helicase [Candidatus Rhodobacter lobularis]KMW59457.1 ATP-dependent RNA helicase RhlE [Candidatus Rhodobacter lobularis]
MTTFAELGLAESLVSRLTEAGISTPTPIQERAIPHVLEGFDLMGLAQTGTGKTAAFGLPLAQRMLHHQEKARPRGASALVLAPTRELAKQIHDNLMAFVGGAHLRVGLVVGGQSVNAQAKRMERGVHILVATPGRLMDLIDRGAVTLEHTEYLVLDEADQMLDLGFIHTLRKIAQMLPAERQTLLFSATMPKLMNEIAGSFLTDPVRVEVSPPGKVADKITQSVHFISQAGKKDLLIECLDAHREELALVFSRTKHGAEKLMKSLVAAGYAAGSIHGNKSQGQRDRALKAFRAGELKILVATDVAARGIDIPDVRYVYNFDLPDVPDNFVHRIGRTARAGAAGRAVAFCAPGEAEALRAIQKVMKLEIPVASGTPWEGVEPPAGRRPSGKPRNGGGRGPKPAHTSGDGVGKPKSNSRRRRRSGRGNRAA